MYKTIKSLCSEKISASLRGNSSGSAFLVLRLSWPQMQSRTDAKSGRRASKDEHLRRPSHKICQKPELERCCCLIRQVSKSVLDLVRAQGTLS